MNEYVVDTDPEARLQVGADMRKIQLCFQLLKVTVMIIQWSPSKMDTIGKVKFVLYKKCPLFRGF